MSADHMAEATRTLKYAYRRPAQGRPFTRCGRCRAQVLADVARTATSLQIMTQLKVKLAKHLETCDGN